MTSATDSSDSTSSLKRKDVADNVPPCNGTQEENLSFKLVYKKDTHNLSLPPSTTVIHLKEKIQELTSVQPAMQKLLYKGTLKEDQKTIQEYGVKNGAKIILMASTVEDVLKVNSIVKNEGGSFDDAPVEIQTPWEQQPIHQKILNKEKPTDSEPGLLNQKFTIPERGIYGLMNAAGQKTRLAFHSAGVLTIGTSDRTQSIPFTSISKIESQKKLVMVNIISWLSPWVQLKNPIIICTLCLVSL